MEEMQSLSGTWGAQTRSRGYGLWMVAAAAGGAEQGFFLVWQSHRRIVPKMKTAPAGIPMMTGQGRLLAEEGATGGLGGLGSEETEERQQERQLEAGKGNSDQMSGLTLEFCICSITYQQCQAGGFLFMCLCLFWLEEVELCVLCPFHLSQPDRWFPNAGGLARRQLRAEETKLLSAILASGQQPRNLNLIYVTWL